mgnify:CR=1 FL=1
MKQIDIEGYEGYFVDREGKVFSSRSGKLKELSQSVQRKYYAVKLHVHGKTKHDFTHRLVAITFIDNPENKPFVNHKDGNKLNNKADNLEWVTRQENVDHAMKHGLVPAMVGEYNGRAILSESDVLEIYSRLLAGDKATEICKDYGVDQTSIANIKQRKSWKHVLKDLPKIEIKAKGNKCSEDKVHEVCKMLEQGVLPTPISKELEVPVDLVYDLKRRKSFSEITKLYVW